VPEIRAIERSNATNISLGAQAGGLNLTF
jgi:hypothetical protein